MVESVSGMIFVRRWIPEWLLCHRGSTHSSSCPPLSERALALCGAGISVVLHLFKKECLRRMCVCMPPCVTSVRSLWTLAQRYHLLIRRANLVATGCSPETHNLTISLLVKRCACCWSTSGHPNDDHNHSFVNSPSVYCFSFCLPDTVHGRCRLFLIWRWCLFIVKER